METTLRKKELVEWLKAVEDEDILLKVHKIKSYSEFEFDKAMKDGLTVEEFKCAMKKEIRAFERRKR